MTVATPEWTSIAQRRSSCSCIEAIPKKRETDYLIVKPSARPAHNLSALTMVSDRPFFPEVRYVYDPVPSQSHSSGLPRRKFPDPPSHVVDLSPSILDNSILLFPHAANLPFRTTLPDARGSRHWTTILSETIIFLEHLAADDSCADVPVKQGITLSQLAKKILRSRRALEDGMVLISRYITPGASAERMRHIAALTIMYFVFDDKAEETPEGEKLRIFRNDFFHKLSPKHRHTDDSENSTRTFQDYLDGIIRGIETEDSEGGNGGRDMIESLQRDAFVCVHPDPEGFQSIEDYLHFRRQNVGASFVIAAIKYSLKLSVPTSSAENPKLSRFLHLFANHLSIANDLASYDKELEAWEQGEASDMINLVDVIKQVTGLTKHDDAKDVALKLQVHVEEEMIGIIEDIKDRVDQEEWWFLRAVLACATGHVFFCMTTSRYGREAARLSY